MDMSSSLSFHSSIGAPIIHNQKIRIRDTFGSGQFQASRDAGRRKHQGLDIIAIPGERVFAPFDCTIKREAVPYKNDQRYRGVVFDGKREWAGYRVKIFYVQGLFSGEAKQGQVIGKAQNLTIKYSGITNHIHVEVRLLGKLIDPLEVWKMSF